ncbi:unnamed protein product [Arabis nemorensis]|uniref:Response regulatory domain-containing protein n=1 Tax=Arabis nemorensis TaxID=586526 RepID=A0A565CVU5_9BRAS|nr:unnamed protein product [Arabis nemorensis]
MSNAIQHESLSSGAMCFIRKPIDSSDLNIVWQHAANCNMNDGSKRIQESSSTNNPYDGDETDPTNHPIDVDGDSTNPNDGDSGAQVVKKPKLKWTNSLYNQFLDAIERIGLDKAVPKKILETMNVKDLTRAQVASKLQKYRKFLKEVKDNGTDLTSVQLSRRGVNSNFVSSSYIDPQHSNNSNTSLGNNNDILSQLRYGVGQSNFMIHNNPSKSQLSYGVGQANVMMNNNAFKSQLSYGVGQPNFRNNNAGSHDSIHYMNRRPTYDMSQTGSDLMSMRTNFGVPNGMLPLMEKSVNIFGTSQDSQAPKFGQFDTTNNVLGLSSNLTTGHMGGNYAGIELSENGDLIAPGGIRVHGNENPSIFNDHHGINEGFNNTINSQIDQHQNQGEMTGENFGVPTGDLLERNEILAPIPPPEDISNWSFNNDNYNDGTLNSVVANSQMQFPTHDLNMTNQELGVGDSMEFSLSFDKDWDDEALHMLESLLGTDMI